MNPCDSLSRRPADRADLAARVHLARAAIVMMTASAFIAAPSRFWCAISRGALCWRFLALLA